MKNRYTLLFLVPLLLILLSCNKDDDKPADPVDQLPPATQIGANTVGCLVNGEAFLPKGGGMSGNKNCYYQFVDGDYYFVVWFADMSGNETHSVSIGTKKATIEEGHTYVLNRQVFFVGSDSHGRGGGYSHYITSPPSEEYFTTTSLSIGEMVITKLDFETNIVSGTFWFDAISDDGEVVEIREGRFDMRFTQ